MARFIVLLAVIASVQGNAVNRVGGWGPPPPTAPPPTLPPPTLPPATTPRWDVTDPPTTAAPPPPPPTTTPGWSPPPPPTTAAPPPPPPTTTPGWSPPPPPPPPPSGLPPLPVNNVTIALEGELAAVGAGWAAENHAENIQVTGGWGVPAELLVSTGGEAVVAQQGSIVQVTNVDDSSASSLNAVSVGQIAAADESLAVIASGLDVLVGQNGWAGAAGEGASAADAETAILVNV